MSCSGKSNLLVSPWEQWQGVPKLQSSCLALCSAQVSCSSLSNSVNFQRMRSHANGILKISSTGGPSNWQTHWTASLHRHSHRFTYRTRVNNIKMRYKRFQKLSVVRGVYQRATCSPRCCLPFISNCQPTELCVYIPNKLNRNKKKEMYIFNWYVWFS